MGRPGTGLPRPLYHNNCGCSFRPVLGRKPAENSRSSITHPGAPQSPWPSPEEGAKLLVAL